MSKYGRVITPDSEEGQRINSVIAPSLATWKAMQQNPQGEYSGLVQTQIDFMIENWSNKKYNWKRLETLIPELLEKTTQLEEPSDEDKEWVLHKIKQPVESWRRFQ